MGYVHDAFIASDRIIADKDLYKRRQNSLIEAVLTGSDLIPPLLSESLGGIRSDFIKYRRYCTSKYPYSMNVRIMTAGRPRPQDAQLILAHLQLKHAGKNIAIVSHELGIFNSGWHNAQYLQDVGVGTPRTYWRYGVETQHTTTGAVNYRINGIDLDLGSIHVTVNNVTCPYKFYGVPESLGVVGSVWTAIEALPRTTHGIPDVPIFRYSSFNQTHGMLLACHGTRTAGTVTPTNYGAATTGLLVEIPIKGEYLQSTVHKVVYTVDGEKFILQVSGSWGTIPGLTDTALHLNFNESYAPVLILQRDKVPFTKDKTSTWYTSTKFASKLLGLDAEEFLDAVSTADSGGPDRSDVYLHFGIGIGKATSGNNERGIESEYMVDYLRYVQATCPNKFIHNLGGIAATQIERYNEILETGGSNGFLLRVQMDNITCFDIPYVGTSSGFPDDFFRDACIAHNKARFAPRAIGNVGIVWPEATSVYWYRRLSNATIRVSAISRVEMFYTVNIPGFPDVRRCHVTNYEAVYFPILNNIIDTVSAHKRQMLLMKAFRSTIMLTSSVKLKWYQTTAFQIIAVVVAVVIAWYAPEVAAYLAETLAVSIEIATVLVSFAMGTVASYAAPLFGSKAWVFHLVLAVIVNPLMLTNPSQYLANIVEAGWGTGMQFAANVSSAASTLMGFYAKREISQIKDEMTSLNKTAKERNEELEAKWLSLSSTLNGPIDVSSILEEDVRHIRNFIFESVSTFYARSLQMHPGLEGVPLISTWASACLALSVNMDGTLDYSRNVVQSITGEDPKWIG